jgi:hypothetical protein
VSYILNIFHSVIKTRAEYEGYENSMLRMILGLKWEEAIGTWGKLRNIIRMVMSRRSR